MDTEKKEVSDGAQIIDQKKVAFIAQLPALLTAIGITPLYFKTTQTSVDVSVVTMEGWEVMFNSFGDPAQQVKNLDVVMSEKIKADRKSLKYVDVRFDNRIFFKL